MTESFLTPEAKADIQEMLDIGGGGGGIVTINDVDSVWHIKYKKSDLIDFFKKGNSVPTIVFDKPEEDGADGTPVIWVRDILKPDLIFYITDSSYYTSSNGVILEEDSIIDCSTYWPMSIVSNIVANIRYRDFADAFREFYILQDGTLVYVPGDEA